MTHYYAEQVARTTQYFPMHKWEENIKKQLKKQLILNKGSFQTFGQTYKTVLKKEINKLWRDLCIVQANLAYYGQVKAVTGYNRDHWSYPAMWARRHPEYSRSEGEFAPRYHSWFPYDVWSINNASPGQNLTKGTFLQYLFLPAILNPEKLFEGLKYMLEKNPAIKDRLIASFSSSYNKEFKIELLNRLQEQGSNQLTYQEVINYVFLMGLQWAVVPKNSNAYHASVSKDSFLNDEKIYKSFLHKKDYVNSLKKNLYSVTALQSFWTYPSGSSYYQWDRKDLTASIITSYRYYGWEDYSKCSSYLAHDNYWYGIPWLRSSQYYKLNIATGQDLALGWAYCLMYNPALRTKKVNSIWWTKKDISLKDLEFYVESLGVPIGSRGSSILNQIKKYIPSRNYFKDILLQQEKTFREEVISNGGKSFYTFIPNGMGIVQNHGGGPTTFPKRNNLFEYVDSYEEFRKNFQAVLDEYDNKHFTNENIHLPSALIAFLPKTTEDVARQKYKEIYWYFLNSKHLGHCFRCAELDSGNPEKFWKDQGGENYFSDYIDMSAKKLLKSPEEIYKYFTELEDSNLKGCWLYLKYYWKYLFEVKKDTYQILVQILSWLSYTNIPIYINKETLTAKNAPTYYYDNIRINPEKCPPLPNVGVYLKDGTYNIHLLLHNRFYYRIWKEYEEGPDGYYTARPESYAHTHAIGPSSADVWELSNIFFYFDFQQCPYAPDFAKAYRLLKLSFLTSEGYYDAFTERHRNYWKDFFNIVLQVASIAIAIYAPYAGGLVGAGASSVSSALTSIAVTVSSQYLVKELSKHLSFLPPEIRTMVAQVLVSVAMSTALGNLSIGQGLSNSFEMLMNPQNLLKLTNAILNSFKLKYEKLTNQALKDADTFQKDYQAKLKEVRDLTKELDENSKLILLSSQIEKESPETFLTRTRLTLLDIAEVNLSAISMFAVIQTNTEISATTAL